MAAALAISQPIPSPIIKIVFLGEVWAKLGLTAREINSPSRKITARRTIWQSQHFVNDCRRAALLLHIPDPVGRVLPYRPDESTVLMASEIFLSKG
jgi:hypothetical protein